MQTLFLYMSLLYCKRERYLEALLRNHRIYELLFGKDTSTDDLIVELTYWNTALLCIFLFSIQYKKGPLYC